MVWLMPRAQTAIGADYKIVGSVQAILPVQALIWVNFMGPLDIVNHLLNFVAPAAAMALLLVLSGGLLGSRSPVALGWWVRLGILFGVGGAVLVAGLVVLGRDGKMLTYAALVLACATCQWFLVRGWRV